MPRPGAHFFFFVPICNMMGNMHGASTSLELYRLLSSATWCCRLNLASFVTTWMEPEVLLKQWTLHT